MRPRVVAVVSLVGVLVAGALIASYFLERVEQPKTVVEPAPPVAEPPRPIVRLAPAVVVDSGVVVEREATPAPTPSREIESPAVTMLSAPTSQALRKLCQEAVDTCSQRHRAWYPSSLTTELELEREGSRSRVVAAHPANSRHQGPRTLLTCITDALKGAALGDLPLEADQAMVRCLPRVPKSDAAFADGARFRDVVKKCLPSVPDQKLTVEFEVVNDEGTLRNGALKFSGFEPDAWARRCIEVGLEASVAVSPDEAPTTTPRVSLSMSEGGSKVSSSYSFSTPR
ncbi:MAG: hypothetical protein ACO1OB_16845 [Archangium sp.]